MFARSSDDLVKQSLTYRYNSQKSRVAIYQSRLTDILGLLKQKNPSLLLQLGKPSAPATTAATSGVTTNAGAGATPRR